MIQSLINKHFFNLLLFTLTFGYSLEKCSIIGSILASNVIQVVGTTLSKKKWDEIKLNIEALLQA